ncbi:MAG TPA: hypothetical protein P5347_01130 [Smithellaceae bacterium]|nr:hypothetical protein [Smithellaceae bacterium]
MMKKVMLVFAVLALLMGCDRHYDRISPVMVPMGNEATAALSAGVIGCRSVDIQIRNEIAHDLGPHEWIATCHGKEYICSYVFGSTTTCKEMVR